MTITIEASGIHEVEQLLQALKSLDIKNVSIKNVSERRQPVIIRGDKKANPRDLFGIWEHAPRSIEQIRSAAWKRPNL